MRSFIFLLILLLALESSIENDPPLNKLSNLSMRNEDEYGCVLPYNGIHCCWVHPTTCCNPKKPSNCQTQKSICCKIKNGKKEDGKSNYYYTPPRRYE